MDNPQQIIETTETIITDMIGHYGWMFIAAFAILLFKNVVSNVLDGLLFMFGHDFDVDDIGNRIREDRNLQFFIS